MFVSNNELKLLPGHINESVCVKTFFYKLFYHIYYFQFLSFFCKGEVFCDVQIKKLLD